MNSPPTKFRREPYVDDADFTLLHGDALTVLRELPDASVDCCLTSPPYYQQRDYGTGAWTGGDPDHEHDTIPARGGRGGSGALDKRHENAMPSRLPAARCSCGAEHLDQQLGLEETPAEYVAAFVDVVRELQRVLRPEGSFWLNIGDSYAANRTYQISQTKHQTHEYGRANASRVPPGLKPKDLIGIPWRLAFALQDDGWWLRSENIWWKPNALPESAEDRPHRAHEHVFQFTQRARYHYDADAVTEPAAWDRWGAQTPRKTGDKKARGASFVKERTRQEVLEIAGLRNLRSVWPINTEPYAEAHFAVMPVALAKWCILAACPVGATVLDPFAGVCTTAVAARELARNSICIELSEENCRMAANRIPRSAQLSLEAEAVA